MQWRIDLDGRPAADALQAIRDVDAPRLGAMDRPLRGDLELIVAKALAKSPAERYPSAAAFAEDLERFLADGPVSARRQSRLYLLRKSIRRHRDWFVLGALALASLVTVAVAASFAAVAKPAHQQRAADLLEALRADPAAAGLFELWQALAEVRLGGPRRRFPEIHAARDPRAAEYAARQVTILAPRDEYGWYLLALALQEQGCYADAIRAIDRARALLDEVAEASLANGIDQGSRNTPLAGPLLTNLATCHALQGNFFAAWPLYAQAWELSGRSPLVLLERAEACYWAGMADAAAADLETAARGTLSQPHLPVPSIGMPLAWAPLTFPGAQLRDPAAARQILVELSMHPGWEHDPTVQTMLAYAQVLTGDSRAALARLAEVAPPDAPGPYRAAVLAAALHTEARGDRAGEWLALADEGARQLIYPDSHLDRLLKLVHQRWNGT